MRSQKFCKLEDLKKYVGLDDIQLMTLKNFRVDIQRFSDLYHLKGIDARTYRVIYEYYYNGVYKRLNPFSQDSLF